MCTSDFNTFFFFSSQVTVHLQAKDLNSVYFSQLCKSTFQWMTKMQPQCMSPRSAVAGGSALLKDCLGNHAAVKSHCSPAHKCYPSIDHSWPSKHAHHGQLHSQVFKTKGNLYTGPVFQPVCYLFAFYPMWILQTLGWKGYLDTWTHIPRMSHGPNSVSPNNTNKTLFTTFFFFLISDLSEEIIYDISIAMCMAIDVFLCVHMYSHVFLHMYIQIQRYIKVHRTSLLVNSQKVLTWMMNFHI